jgi:DNA-3-methyladenine glycosylase I
MREDSRMRNPICWRWRDGIRAIYPASSSHSARVTAGGLARFLQQKSQPLRHGQPPASRTIASTRAPMSLCRIRSTRYDFSLPDPTRCQWPRTPLDIEYHDREWGAPVHDDRVLLEFLILEGAQAGLSWSTILKKRENYRKAFAGFDPRKVARFRPEKLERLMQDPGIVRNRLKIAAAVQNAKAFLQVQREFGSFDRFIWQFTGGQPKMNRWVEPSQVPARSAESDAMSRELLRRGFKFVGSTICYAYMQATGMVNDHSAECFRYRELGGLAVPVKHRKEKQKTDEEAGGRA